MSTVRKFSYRSDLGELGRICGDVAAYCREHGIDPDTALALTLCLDELFTNTIKYGYTAATGAHSNAASTGCHTGHQPQAPAKTTAANSSTTNSAAKTPADNCAETIAPAANNAASTPANNSAEAETADNAASTPTSNAAETPAPTDKFAAHKAHTNGHLRIADLLVEIHLERHEDRVQVHYRDKGHPFDPFSNQPPLPDMSRVCPEKLPTGGFGIHLLRKLSSEARYTREGDHNTISLTFSWHS